MPLAAPVTSATRSVSRFMAFLSGGCSLDSFPTPRGCARPSRLFASVRQDALRAPPHRRSRPGRWAGKAADEAEQLADRIAILHEGKIIANGTLTDLKKLFPPAKVEYVEKQPTLEEIFLAIIGKKEQKQQ
jgi:hypothetical protein